MLNETNPTRAKDQSLERRAVVTSLTMSGVMLFMLLLLVIIGWQHPENYSYARTTILILAVFSLASAWLSRRGRVVWGGVLILTGLYGTVIFFNVQLSGLGFASAAVLLVVNFGIASAMFPAHLVNRANAITLSVAAVPIFLDVFEPFPRLPNSYETISTALAAVLVVVYGLLILRQFNSYALRAKLMIATMLIAGGAVLAVTLVSSIFQQRVVNFLQGELESVFNSQVEQTLDMAVTGRTELINRELTEISQGLESLAHLTAVFLSDEEIYGQGIYWDARGEMVKLPSGVWDNQTPGLASAVVPGMAEFNEATIAELNALQNLDFAAPAYLETHPLVNAVYFTSARKLTRYYPDIDLAAVTGNYDPTGDLFYTVAIPANNPERRGVWTLPYQDPALTGLMVTLSVPVYDRMDVFRGTLSADVRLAGFQERVAKVEVGQTAYGFILDAQGRLLALPEAGYRDLGITPEEVEILASPEQTLEGAGSAEFQAAVDRMLRGEAGMASAKIGEADYYVAFRPIPVVGYSLGVMVKRAEVDAFLVDSNQRVAAERRTAQQSQALLVIAIFVLALALAVGLAQVLAAPIGRLIGIAERVGAGDLAARARVETDDEVGRLANTFNTMTNQLQQTLQSLEQRVAERTRALETSAEVSRRISTILDQRTLATEVVEQVQSAFGYYHAHIYLFDETRETLLMVGGTGEAGQTMLARGHKMARGRGLVGRAADSNLPVLVADTTQDANWLANPLLPDTQAEVAVPIALGENVLGVLDVQHNVVNGLSQADVDILQSLANQVAVALQNARAYADAQRQADREALIGVIHQRIRETSSVEDALMVAARELGRAVGAPQTLVRLGLTSQKNELES